MSDSTRTVLCGKCRRPLGDGMISTVVDTIEGVFSERRAKFCDNPGCGAATYIIEETTQPLQSRIAALAGRFWQNRPRIAVARVRRPS